MAKSLRSKRKRKMRAVKRIRYGEKELARLKEMVAKTEEKEAKASGAIQKLVGQFTNEMDVDGAASKKIKAPKSADSTMETDELSKKIDVKRTTMLNKDGQYPEWMNSRRIKKQKAVVKRLKNKKKK